MPSLTAIGRLFLRMPSLPVNSNASGHLSAVRPAGSRPREPRRTGEAPGGGSEPRNSPGRVARPVQVMEAALQAQRRNRPTELRNRRRTAEGRKGAVVEGTTAWTAGRVYADRTSRGDSDHRYPGSHSLSGLCPGARDSACRELLVQWQTDTSISSLACSGTPARYGIIRSRILAMPTLTLIVPWGCRTSVANP